MFIFVGGRGDFADSLGDDEGNVELRRKQRPDIMKFGDTLRPNPKNSTMLSRMGREKL